MTVSPLTSGQPLWSTSWGTFAPEVVVTVAVMVVVGAETVRVMVVVLVSVVVVGEVNVMVAVVVVVVGEITVMVVVAVGAAQLGQVASVVGAVIVVADPGAEGDVAVDVPVVVGCAGLLEAVCTQEQAELSLELEYEQCEAKLGSPVVAVWVVARYPLQKADADEGEARRARRQLSGRLRSGQSPAQGSRQGTLLYHAPATNFR